MSSNHDDAMGKPEREPSYALVGFSRINYGGRGATLFGSSIKHDHTIRLRIHRAEKRRELSRDWYYAHEPIVEVEMSPTQFAEAITCMNMGDGVPCTLTHLGLEAIPPPTAESKREQFVGEFREHAEEVGARLDALEAFAAQLRDKPSVTKRDRDELIEKIRMARQEIALNMPFVADQFNRQMERTVHEAKGEVEAFFLHKVLSAGLAAVQEDGLEGLAKVPVAIEGPDR